MTLDAPIESSDASTVDIADPRKITTAATPSFANQQELNTLKELDVVNKLEIWIPSCGQIGILATEQCWLCEESCDVENQPPLVGHDGKHCSQDERQANDSGHAIHDALHSSQIAQLTTRNRNSPLCRSSSLRQGRLACQPERHGLSDRLQAHAESHTSTEWYVHLDCLFPLNCADMHCLK
jgi:hypothetical protein